MDTNLSYIYRCIAWSLPNLTDHRRFPTQPVPNNPERLMPLPPGSPLVVGPVTITHQQKSSQQPLESFLQQSGTTSFLIIHRNKLIYENYFDGYTANNVVTSLSVTHALVSALVGIALSEGVLPGLDSPVLAQLPELANHISPALTIRHLLCMSSGLLYREGGMPWCDEARIQYSSDLRQQLLQCESIEPSGRYYHYNAYNLLLLGRLLENATGLTVPDYCSQKLWSRMGTEQPASWNIDSNSSGFAKLDTGFNATARDFARFGLLYLNQGQFENQQIVPEAWIKQSTSTPLFDEAADYKRYLSRDKPPLGQWISSPIGYYKYLWWGYHNGPHQEADFFALGDRGQFIYCSPLHETVIVRFGKRWGNIDWWPVLFRELIAKMNA